MSVRYRPTDVGPMSSCLLRCQLTVGQRSVGSPKKRFIDHIKANLLKCNIKPSDMEALASDRNIWRTVCDTGLRSFLNGWITASEERRAARHTASTKPKTGQRCPQCSRVCGSVPPISDSGVRCGPTSRPATLSSSVTSSSNSTDFSSSTSNRPTNYWVAIPIAATQVLAIDTAVQCTLTDPFHGGTTSQFKNKD